MEILIGVAVVVGVLVALYILALIIIAALGLSAYRKAEKEFAEFDKRFERRKR